MKNISWNDEKNRHLRLYRNISFEDILYALSHDGLLDIIHNPNFVKYPDQKVLIVNVNKYAYCVPVLETEDEIFLKTIFPSRKYIKNILEE